MKGSACGKTWLTALLWLALALPPARALLEASMARQMLMQMPLLALVGWWLAAALPASWRDAIGSANAHGINGFLLASFTGMLWMVPRMLDESLDLPWVELAKFTSIPLLIGLPLALSWPRAGFVLRAAVLVEAIATTFRLAWLYLASPVRLCSSYLLDDQQRLGQGLLALGIALCVLLGCKLMWGHIRVEGS